MSGIYRSADSTRPAGQAITVVASDATIIPVTRALYIGTGGTLTVTMGENNATALFVNVANGTLLPIQVSQVRATGTTAADILALY